MLDICFSLLDTVRLWEDILEEDFVAADTCPINEGNIMTATITIIEVLQILILDPLLRGKQFKIR